MTNRIRTLVQFATLVNTPRLRGPIHLPALAVLIAFITVPGFAQSSKPVRHTGPYYMYKDPAAKECSHSGLPCSSAPLPASGASSAGSSLQQLSQIERESMNAIRSAPKPANSKSVPVYHPMVTRGSEPINSVYHEPRANEATAASRSRLKTR